MSTEPESPPAPAGIYAAMAAIMGEVSPIAKAQRNNEQKFLYRGIDDVYNALNPLMAEHRVFMVPTVTDRATEERTTKSGNHMSCVTLTVEYRFFHADGSCITCTVMGEGRDTADKATNKAMAAAHKYALLQTFCIPTADLGRDDPDRETPEDLAPHGSPRGATPPPRPNLDAIKRTLAGFTSVEALTAYWPKVGVRDGHPDYLQMVNLFGTRKTELLQAVPVQAVPVQAAPAQTAPPLETPPSPPQSGAITPEQIKAVQTAYSGWSREDRLMDISERLGRTVNSVKELSDSEASALFESFNRAEAAA